MPAAPPAPPLPPRPDIPGALGTQVADWSGDTTGLETLSHVSHEETLKRSIDADPQTTLLKRIWVSPSRLQNVLEEDHTLHLSPLSAGDRRQARPAEHLTSVAWLSDKQRSVGERMENWGSFNQFSL